MALIPALLPHQADVVVAILEQATGANPNASLIDVLQAYEDQLPKFGLSTGSDTFFYRFFLHLSLNSAHSWWQKLQEELLKARHAVDPRISVWLTRTAGGALPSASTTSSSVPSAAQTPASVAASRIVQERLQQQAAGSNAHSSTSTLSSSGPGRPAASSSSSASLSDRVAHALSSYQQSSSSSAAAAASSSTTFSSASRTVGSAPPPPPPPALSQFSSSAALAASLSGSTTTAAATGRRPSLGDISADSGIARGGVDSGFAAAQASRLEKLKQTAALAQVGTVADPSVVRAAAAVRVNAPILGSAGGDYSVSERMTAAPPALQGAGVTVVSGGSSSSRRDGNNNRGGGGGDGPLYHKSMTQLSSAPSVSFATVPQLNLKGGSVWKASAGPTSGGRSSFRSALELDSSPTAAGAAAGAAGSGSRSSPSSPSPMGSARKQKPLATIPVPPPGSISAAAMLRSRIDPSTGKLTFVLQGPDPTEGLHDLRGVSASSAEALSQRGTSRSIQKWAGPGLLQLDASRSLPSVHNATPVLEDRYATFRMKSQVFRAWVAFVVFTKERRRVSEEMAVIKLGAAQQARRSRLLRTTFRQLKRAAQSSKRERLSLIAALQHWSASMLRKSIKGWKILAVSRRPQPLYHPMMIRALFKWIGLTLPDRGEWWRLAASYDAAMRQGLIAGPHGPYGAAELTPAQRAFLASAPGAANDDDHDDNRQKRATEGGAATTTARRRQTVSDRLRDEGATLEARSARSPVATFNTAVFSLHRRRSLTGFEYKAVVDSVLQHKNNNNSKGMSYNGVLYGPAAQQVLSPRKRKDGGAAAGGETADGQTANGQRDGQQQDGGYESSDSDDFGPHFDPAGTSRSASRRRVRARGQTSGAAAAVSGQVSDDDNDDEDKNDEEEEEEEEFTVNEHGQVVRTSDLDPKEKERRKQAAKEKRRRLKAEARQRRKEEEAQIRALEEQQKHQQRLMGASASSRSRGRGLFASPRGGDLASSARRFPSSPPALVGQSSRNEQGDYYYEDDDERYSPTGNRRHRSASPIQRTVAILQGDRLLQTHLRRDRHHHHQNQHQHIDDGDDGYDYAAATALAGAGGRIADPRQFSNQMPGEGRNPVQPLLGMQSAVAFAGSVMQAAKDRQRRLGRLRAYVVTRVAPPLRKLPLLEHATAIVDAHALLVIFNAWKQRTLAAKRLRANAMRKQAISAIERWRVKATTNTRLKRKAATTQALCRRRTLKQMWAQWFAEHCEVKYVQSWSKVTGGLADAWLLHRMFKRWRRYRVLVRRLKNKWEEHRLGMLKYAVDAMRSLLTQKKELKAKAAALTAKLDARTTERHFREWQTCAKTSKVLARARSMFGGSPYVRFFWALKTARGLQVEEDAQAIEQYKQGKIRRIFKRWQNLRNEIVRGREAAETLRSLKQQRIMKKWHRWASHHYRVRTAQAELEEKRLLRNAAKGLRDWMFVAKREIKDKATLATFATSKKERTIKSCLQAWNDATATKQRLRNMINRMKNAKVLKAIGTWREVTATRIDNRNKINRFVGRMQNLHITLTFNALRSNVGKQKTKRDLAAKTAQLSFKLRASRGIRAMRSFANSKKKDGGRLQGIMEAMERWHLKRIFERWSEMSAEAARTRKIMKNVVTKMQNAKAVASIRIWREYTAERVHEKQLMAGVVHRMKNAKVMSAIKTWREVTKEALEKKAVMANVVNRLKNAKALGLIRRWRDWASERGQEKALESKATVAIKQSRMLSALRNWRDYASETSRNREVMANVLYRMQNQKTLSAVRRWLDFTRQRIKEREIIARLSAKLQSGALIQTFNAWRKYTNEEKRLKNVMRSVVARFRNSTAVSYVRQWRETARRARIVRERKSVKDDVTARKLITNAMQAWKEYTEEQKRVKGLMQDVARKLRNGAVGRTVDTWRNWARERIESREIIRKLRAKLQNGALIQTFNAWRGYAQEEARTKKLMRQVLTRMRNASVMTTITTWRDRTKANIARRTAGAEVAHRHRHRMLNSVISRLSANRAAAMENAHKAEKHWNDKEEAFFKKVIASWKEATDESLEMKAKLRSVVTMMTKGGMVKAVRVWRLQTQARLWLEYIRWQSEDFNAKRLQKRFFASLKSKANLRQKIGSTIPKLEVVARKATQRAYLAKWLENAREMGTMGELYRRADNAWKTRCLRSSWALWQGFTEDRKHDKAVMSRVVARMQHASTVRLLTLWRDKTRLSVLSRVGASRYRNRLAATAFTAWKSWIGAKNDKRAKAANLASKLLTAWRQGMAGVVFSGWRSWAKEGRQEKNETTAFQKCVSAQRMRLSIDRWKKLLLARFHHRSQTKKLCLRAWHRFAALKAAGVREAEQTTEATRLVIFKQWREMARERRRETLLATEFVRRASLPSSMRKKIFMTTTASSAASEPSLSSSSSSAAAALSATGSLADSSSSHPPSSTWAGSLTSPGMNLVRAVAHRWMHIGTVPAFQAWFAYHRKRIRARELRKIADAIERQRSMARAWVGWKESLQLSLKEHAAAYHRDFVLQRKALLGWRGAVTMANANRVLRVGLLWNVLEHAAKRKKREALGIWRDLAAGDKALDNKADRFALSRKQGAARVALVRWRRISHRANMVKTVLAAISFNYAKGFVRNLMAAWHRYAREKRQRKVRADSFYVGRRVRLAVDSWRRRTQSEIQMQMRREAVHALVVRRSKALSLIKWKAELDAKLHRQQQEESAEQLRRSLQLRSVFRPWVRYSISHSTNRSKQLQYTRALVKSSLRTVLSEWRDLAVTNKLRLSLEQGKKRRALITWRKKVGQVMLSRRLDHEDLHLKARAFTHLRQYALQRQKKVIRIAAAINAIDAGVVKRAFAAWFDVVFESKAYRQQLATEADLRSRVEAKFSRAVMRKKAVIFRAWALHSDQMRSSKAIARRFVLKTAGRELLDGWKLATIKAHQQRQAAMAMESVVQHRRARKSFVHWRKATRQAYAGRALVTALEAAYAQLVERRKQEKEARAAARAAAVMGAGSSGSSGNGGRRASLKDAGLLPFTLESLASADINDEESLSRLYSTGAALAAATAGQSADDDDNESYSLFSSPSAALPQAFSIWKEATFRRQRFLEARADAYQRSRAVTKATRCLQVWIARARERLTIDRRNNGLAVEFHSQLSSRRLIRSAHVALVHWYRLTRQSARAKGQAERAARFRRRKVLLSVLLRWKGLCYRQQKKSRMAAMTTKPSTREEEEEEEYESREWHAAPITTALVRGGARSVRSLSPSSPTATSPRSPHFGPARASAAASAAARRGSIGSSVPIVIKGRRASNASMTSDAAGQAQAQAALGGAVITAPAGGSNSGPVPGFRLFSGAVAPGAAALPPPASSVAPPLPPHPLSVRAAALVRGGKTGSATIAATADGGAAVVYSVSPPRGAAASGLHLALGPQRHDSSSSSDDDDNGAFAGAAARAVKARGGRGGGGGLDSSSLVSSSRRSSPLHGAGFGGRRHHDDDEENVFDDTAAAALGTGRNTASTSVDFQGQLAVSGLISGRASPAPSMASFSSASRIKRLSGLGVATTIGSMAGSGSSGGGGGAATNAPQPQPLISASSRGHSRASRGFSFGEDLQLLEEEDEQEEGEGKGKRGGFSSSSSSRRQAAPPPPPPVSAFIPLQSRPAVPILPPSFSSSTSRTEGTYIDVDSLGGSSSRQQPWRPPIGRASASKVLEGVIRGHGAVGTAASAVLSTPSASSALFRTPLPAAAHYPHHHHHHSSHEPATPLPASTATGQFSSALSAMLSTGGSVASLAAAAKGGGGSSSARR